METCFNEENIMRCLAEMKTQLLEMNPIKINEDISWIKSINCKSGVYIFLNKGTPYYVGESANVGKRMIDFTRTRNHTLRRRIGSKVFANEPGFEKASSTKGFSVEIERKITTWCCDNLEVVFLEVKFGRKELEEYLIDEFRTDQKSKRKP